MTTSLVALKQHTWIILQFGRSELGQRGSHLANVPGSAGLRSFLETIGEELLLASPGLWQNSVSCCRTETLFPYWLSAEGHSQPLACSHMLPFSKPGVADGVLLASHLSVPQSPSAPAGKTSLLLRIHDLEFLLWLSRVRI